MIVRTVANDHLARVFRKVELTLIRIKINHYEIAGLDLLRCDEVREGIHQKSFDRPLQVSCSVLEVDSLSQQKLFRRVGTFKDKLRARRLRNAVLHGAQLDVQNAAKV